VAVLDAPGIVTDPGTVRLPVFELRVATMPAAPAGPFNVIVQVLEAEELSEFGLHDKLLIAGALTVLAAPPFAETATELPARDAPNELATVMGTDETPGASSTETVATTPLAIVFELIPTARQVYAVGSPPQLTDLPAEAEALPVATVKLTTEVEG
jgi:hypothetical protein